MADDTNPYDAVAAEYVKAQQASAQVNLAEAQGPDKISPDVAGQTFENATKAGIPYGVASLDRDVFNREEELKRQYGKISDNPGLLEYFASGPHAAQVSWDDIDQLGVVSKTVKAITSGLKEGTLESMVGSLGESDPKAFIQGAPPVSARDLMLEQANIGKMPGGYGFVQTLASGVGHTLHAMLSGGMAGATVGAMAGATTGPGSPVAAPIGAAGGFFTGTAIKLGMDAAVAKNLEYADWRSPTGKSMPAPVRIALASGVGVLTGLLFSVGAPATFKSFATDVLETSAKNPTVWQFLKNTSIDTAKAGGTFATINEAQLFMTTAAQDLTKLAIDPTTPTIFNDPQKVEELKQQSIDAITTGFALGGVFHGVGSIGQGVSLLADLAKARRAPIELQAHDEAFNAAQASKTRERSPEAFRQFIETQTDDHHISVPVAAIDQVLGPSAEEQLSFVPNIERQLEVARDTGGDVSIPFADWLARATPELAQSLHDHLRVTVDGLTLDEARRVMEEGPINREMPTLEQLAKLSGQKFPYVAEGPGPLGNMVETAGEHLRDLQDSGAFGGVEPVTPAGLKLTPAEQKFFTEALKDRNNDPYEIFDEVPSAKIVDGKLQWDPVETGYLVNWINRTRDLMRGEKLPPSFYSPNSLMGRMEGAPDTYEIKPNEVKPLKLDIQQIAENADAMRLRMAEEAARRELYLSPLFKDPASAGMTKDEFARYSKPLEEIAQAAFDRAVAKVKGAIKKRQTAEWKANRAEMREEVQTDFRYRPDLLADQYFRTGILGNRTAENPVKLDRDIVVKKYGADVANELPDYVFPRKARVKEGFQQGIHPDVAASVFGMKSGDALINQLSLLNNARKARDETPAEYLKRIIDEETDRRMEAKYGLLQENIMEEARNNVTGPKQEDFLADELNILAQRAGINRPFTKDELQAAAKADFDKLPLKQAQNLNAFIRQTGRAGRQAELALLRGNIPAAFEAKNRQLINMMMLKQAQEFKKTYDKTVKVISRYGRQPVVPTVDQAYTDQVHSLLRSLGLRIPRTGDNLDRALGGKSLADFIQEKTAEGRIIAPPTFVPGKPLSDFTAEDFQSLSDTLQSLIHNGRDAKTITIRGQRFEYETKVGEVLKNLDALEKKNFDPRARSGIRNKLRWIGRVVDSGMFRMEQFSDEIDRGDPMGPFNQYIFRPMKDALNYKIEKTKEIAEKFKELPHGFAWRRQMRQHIDNDTLLDPETGQPLNLTEGNLVQMILNWGSESNIQKMIQGWGWDRQEVKDFFDKNSRKEHWDFAQKIWDILDSTMRADVERVTKNMSGVAVDLIKAQPIDTPFGRYRGGYYPLMEDEVSAINRSRADVKEPFENVRMLMLPTASAVKARTGKLYPTSLALDDLGMRINETIHFLAFAEPMLQVRKFITDPEIRKGITRAFGPEYTEQLNPWLNHIASDGGFRDLAGQHYLNNFLRYARENTGTMLLGFNLTTPRLHGGSALSNSLAEIPAKAIPKFIKETGIDVPAAAVSNMYDLFFRNQQNMENIINFVYSKSPEVRNRKLSLDSSMLTQLQKAVGESGLPYYRAAFQQYAMSWIGYLDQWSAIPTWKVIYDSALAAGKSEEDAIFLADKAVRNAHGSSTIVDAAAFQRGGDAWRWFTMFMGYFVHNYNRIRSTYRLAAGKNDTDAVFGSETEVARMATVAARTMAYIIIPAAIHHYFRGRKDDKAGWGSVAADAILGQTGGGLPVARDLLYDLEHEKPGSNPYDEFVGGLANSLIDLKKAAEGKKVSNRWVQHALEAPGWTMGFSSKSIGRAGQFLWDVHKHRQTPQNLNQWWLGISTGSTKERK